MVRFSILSVATVLLGATLAQAAVIGVATLVRDPGNAINFTSPDAALAAPWVGYTLGLQSTAGELIGGVDVSIKGQLHQRWTFDEDAGAFVPTGNSANITNGDSHLRAIAGAIFGSGPTEDNPGTGSPLADTATADYGVGTTLAGAWGITNAATTANLAYIVVPKGSEPTLDIRVQIADPGGVIIGDLNATAFGFPPPGLPPIVNNFTDSADLNEVIATTITTSQGTAPITWGNLANPTYTPGFGAKPNPTGAFFTPVWNPATQSFSWDTAGSTRGTYTWDVQATNGSGNDVGTISIDVPFVPEPTSLVLVGLALAGFAGFRRK